VANTIKTTLSLFSGTGGLDLGWELATGSRVVGYCERDAYAASILLARMEDEALEPAPIWCGDICELPLEPFRGVDAIIGGFPCQDISAAGKGAGIYGERSGLWGRGFVRAIRELRPRYVFAENVQTLRSRGLAVVIQDLALLGYDTQWCRLSAGAVGASHRRERMFILAHAQSERERESNDKERAESREDAREDASGRSSAVGDPYVVHQPEEQESNAAVSEQRQKDGRGEQFASRAGTTGRTALGSLAEGDGPGEDDTGAVSAGENALVNPSSARRAVGHAEQPKRRSDTERGRQRVSGRSATEESYQGCAPIFAPGPASDDWQRITIDAPHLAPAIEPGVCVLVDGSSVVVDTSRADQLRCVGNGVVALQAAVAARLLQSIARNR